MKKLLILLLPLTLIFKYIASLNPSLVEGFYSDKLYRLIIATLTSISKFIPFSISEIIVIILSILAIFYILKAIAEKYKNKKKFLFKNFILRILSITAVIYFLFNILWGFNYYRYPYSIISGLGSNIKDYKDLEGLCLELIKNTNKYRKNILEDSNGVMKLGKGKEYVLTHASIGFEIISSSYPFLTGNYGRAKGIKLSLPMSYTGITGFYFPYTGEANVNLMTPDSLFPATVCHELSHQRGFAREDESNYIAYISCINHTDDDFKYSGYLLALINVLGPLRMHDSDAYKELITLIDSGVKRDINYLNTFWDKYEGPITKISDRINDIYLKSNNQPLGVESYGRMVDLLILDYRKRAFHEGS